MPCDGIIDMGSNSKKINIWNTYLCLLFCIIYFITRNNNDDGSCVLAKMEGGEAKWVITNCDNANTKGVVCARRTNWEEIGNISPRKLIICF